MSLFSFPVAINTQFTDKIKPGDGRFWEFNMTFENENLTLPQLLEHIRQGHAWTAPHEHVRRPRHNRHNPDYQTTYRVKENVIGSQLLALDSDTEDERATFPTLLQDPFFGRYGGLLHASSSSTPDRPRTRILFVLDEILDRAAYELALKALLFRYPYCDQSVNHAAVAFYGAADCEYHLTENVLPISVLYEVIIKPYQAFLQADQQQREEERQRRLAELGTTDSPNPVQVTRYVRHVVQSELDDLATTNPRQGLRHRKLFVSALKLSGLRESHWLTVDARQLLANLEWDLFDAAEINGYAADYGDDDAWRTIENGVDIGRFRLYTEPVWYDGRPYLKIGDEVEAVVRGRMVARGKISRWRENEHWEYMLEDRPNVWFALELCRLINNNS